MENATSTDQGGHCETRHGWRVLPRSSFADHEDVDVDGVTPGVHAQDRPARGDESEEAVGGRAVRDGAVRCTIMTTLRRKSSDIWYFPVL